MPNYVECFIEVNDVVVSVALVLCVLCNQDSGFLGISHDLAGVADQAYGLAVVVLFLGFLFW